MLLRLFLAVVVVAAWLASPARAFETAARSAIIIDNRTGAVLFEKNADERLPPASMSKLMTAYMIFDSLKSGRLKLDDEITVSERSWKMGGSQMFVKVGDRVKVEDLIRGIIVQSGNDACVAMAESIAGSEEEFAREMTEKGHEIGLTNSTFANSTGLDAPEHLMTVRDLALSPRQIIAEFPEYFKYYGEREFEYGGIKQPNRNPLLQANVPGVDGMKTGFTDGPVTVSWPPPSVMTAASSRCWLGSIPPRSAGSRASGCWSTASASSRNTPCSGRASPSPTRTSGWAPRRRCRWRRPKMRRSPCRARRARVWSSSSAMTVR